MTDYNEEQTYWKCRLLFYWAEQEDLHLNISERSDI